MAIVYCDTNLGIMKDRPIFIIGFMGSGKTSLGKALAARLQKCFIDTDDFIVEQVGLSVSDIFQKHGEAHFRRLEADTLRSLVASDCVVATGGGMPIYHENMSWMLNRGTVVFLDVSWEILKVRLKDHLMHRPLLAKAEKRIEEKIKTLYISRQEVYQQAHIVWDNNDALTASVDQLVQAIIELQ